MCKNSTEVRLRDSPAQDLLSETLEWLFRKRLSEDVSELFLVETNAHGQLLLELDLQSN